LPLSVSGQQQTGTVADGRGVDRRGPRGLVRHGAAIAGGMHNVELSARSSDAAWLRAFHAVVPPLLARLRPQILVSQHGADTHRRDPLAHCQSAPARQR